MIKCHPNLFLWKGKKEMSKFVKIKGPGNISFKNKTFRLPGTIKINNDSELEQLKVVLKFYGITNYELFERLDTPFPLTRYPGITEKEKNKIVIEDEEVLSLLEEYARKEE